jgi:hypothetical protein
VPVSPPGTGKTSLLPLALADALDGQIVLAKPRRIATRAAAGRLAELLGEQPGGRLGCAMRGKRGGGAQTRIEVVTTGCSSSACSPIPKCLGSPPRCSGLGQDLYVPLCSMHPDPLSVGDQPGGMFHSYDGW